MAKQKPIPNNADLPPTLVIATFVTEKKRKYVESKLKQFGLVRKEYYNRKSGHKKADFKLKKFLGKRYRYATAPMTDDEVQVLFDQFTDLQRIVNPSLGLPPTPSTSSASETTVATKSKVKSGFLRLLLTVFGLAAFGGGGYAAYLVYSSSVDLSLEFASIIAAASILFAFTFLALARILKVISRS
jgi:hypothetical protein